MHPVLDQDVGEGNDAGERRSQLVRNHRHEPGPLGAGSSKLTVFDVQMLDRQALASYGPFLLEGPLLGPHQGDVSGQDEQEQCDETASHREEDPAGHS